MSKEIKFELVSRVIELEECKDLKLPEKGSKKAAGYDFYSAENVIIPPFKSPADVVYVKTGVKAEFPDDVALLLLNRSSNPKKKGLFIANGVGLVDADYYNNSANEGEIAFAFINMNLTPVEIHINDKLGQGMFVNYRDLTNFSDSDIAERKGGFGSSDE